MREQREASLGGTRLADSDAPPGGPGARAPSSRARRFVRVRGRLLAGVVAVLFATVALRWSGAEDRGTRDASLRAWLENRGHAVHADLAAPLWFTLEGSVLFTHRVVWIGADAGGAPDVYVADVRATEGGAVLDVAWRSNITRTSGAVERHLVRVGSHVAYASELEGKLDAVGILDLRGEDESLTDAWPLRMRIQNAVTNLQETGASAGVGRLRYRVLKPAGEYSLSERAGRFVLRMPGGTTELEPGRVRPLVGEALVEARPESKGMPGTISWVVDTVRNTSFVGKEPIEWLENRVFGAKDWALRTWYGWVGEDKAETEATVREELSVAAVTERRRVELAEASADIGWPPRPMKPMIEPVRGEGEWLPVVDDPYVKSVPGAPPFFYQSFLRVDPERTFARVYITVWDPRVLQLHIMTGTKEPMSATGETGAGMAPRDPAVLERVVAGFNGGFQALHGEFGMMADGRVYIPPKPWAATVAVYDDGQVKMGSWDPPPKGVRDYAEDWATAQIPANMISLRQNLTSVVEDGKYNPWERWWWGAAPVDATEQTLIDRSGLCLTEEGFLAYFWGQSMSADALGAAMLRARCVRGIHLDMNSAHTGFEYYNVSRTPMPPLGTPPNDDEFDGKVPLASQLFLRARRMVRSMSTMRFPRYIGRDARDFFYLTARPTLPGPPIAVGAGAGEEGAFRADGLASAHFPRPYARAFLGADESKRTWLVRIDPSAVLLAGAAAVPATGGGAAAGPGPAQEGAADGEELARFNHAEGSSGSLALYTPVAAPRSGLGARLSVGAPPSGARVWLRGEPLDAEAGAALGVDAHGFLVYAERVGRDPVALAERLAQAGVTGAMGLGRQVRLVLAAGDDTFVGPDAYEREADRKGPLLVRADSRPRAAVLNPDLKPAPYWKWARLQDARVRYFRDGPARFQMPADGGVPEP